jgi:oxygen-independent coproporphyrinogen-3 oxidase
MQTVLPRTVGCSASPSDLLAKYDGRAPRYTSYPTATQFSNAVGAKDYRQWLAALPPNKAISLYVHIPFCRRLCWYCGCNTRVVSKAELISRYVDGLRDELALLEQVLPGRLPVAAIHLGGGTPNLLSRDDMVVLFSTLRHVFAVRPGAEISVEADPAVMTYQWAKAAAFHGATRVSLGVQDLNPQVQHAVNRIETFEEVQDAVGALRNAGIERVSFDLMYGLPKQTTSGLLGTIDQVLRLRPNRIALFGYAHVPWMKAHQSLIREEDLPGGAERLDQARAAAAAFIAAGYVQIGLDHFAQPTDPLAMAEAAGTLHRNFQGYTTDACDTLIAIGASGIGRLTQGYVQNQTQELAWRAALSLGELPIARGVAVTAEDRFRADIIEHLMCDMEVDLAAVCARHGKTLGHILQEREDLDQFVRDGLLIQDDRGIHVTEQGRPFVRAIGAVFDTYLRKDLTRHSQVV